MLKWIKVRELKGTLNSSRKSKFSPERFDTIRALGRTHSKWAISSLTEVLLDNRNVVEQRIAAEALGELGSTDPKSINALLRVLRDVDRRFVYEVREEVEATLIKLGWIPETELDSRKIEAARKRQEEARQAAERAVEEDKQVHSWMYSEDEKMLKANWELTKRVLLRDLANGSPDAAKLLVKNGDEGDTYLLIRTLKKQHRSNTKFAEVLLNCGHKKLEIEAAMWATDNKCGISRQSGSPGVRWGTLRQ